MSSSAGTTPNNNGTKPINKTNGNTLQTPVKGTITRGTVSNDEESPVLFTPVSYSLPAHMRSPPGAPGGASSPYSPAVPVNLNAVLASQKQSSAIDFIPKSVVATGIYTPTGNRLGTALGNSGALPGPRPPTLATGPHAGHVSGLTGSATSVTHLAPTQLSYPIKENGNAPPPKRTPGSSGGRRRKTKHRKHHKSKRHMRKHRKTRRRVHFDRI
jgi:hypothetical protein